MEGDAEGRGSPREGGNRWEKPPSGASQSPLGASVAKIVTILPCSWLLLLLRSLVIAGLGIVEHKPRVRLRYLNLPNQPMARGGPASRSLVPGIAAACPFGPPALQKLPQLKVSIRPTLLLPQSVDGPFHVKSPSIFSSLPCSSFSRPNRAGASNPGDCSRSSLSMRRRPWPPYDLLQPCDKAPR